MISEPPRLDGDFGSHIDLALGVFPDLPLEFRTQALFPERFACVVRNRHPRVKGKMTLKSFRAMKHVLVAPRGRAGSTVDTALAERGMSREVTRFVPYFVVALDLVSRTDCVLTVSERLALAYAERLPDLAPRAASSGDRAKKARVVIAAGFPYNRREFYYDERSSRKNRP